MAMSKNLDYIFIRDLVVKMSAGIYEHEKQAKQRVIINIDLEVKSNITKNLNSISDVVSYEDITNEVINTANSKHYDLLEVFAEDIAQTCLAEEQVISARIRVEKPDIIENTKSVGVEIIRS